MQKLVEQRITLEKILQTEDKTLEKLDNASRRQNDKVYDLEVKIEKLQDKIDLLEVKAYKDSIVRKTCSECGNVSEVPKPPTKKVAKKKAK